MFRYVFRSSSQFERCVKLLRGERTGGSCLRFFSEKRGSGDEGEKGGKYNIFRDEEAPVILDVEEEREAGRVEASPSREDWEGLNTRRGKNGVFDVVDLVELLRRDGARDVVVVKVPEELKYVDFLVVASGTSKRHLLGLAEFVRKVYKLKRHASDPVPHIEGEQLSQWLAMDLGNIALHLMSKEARWKYDLESLWSVGREYDAMTQTTADDALHRLLEKHAVTLDDFHPATKLS